MKPWSEVVERSSSVVLRTNSSYAAVEAVKVGYGISVFPDYVTKSSNLVRGADRPQDRARHLAGVATRRPTRAPASAP